MDTKEIYTKPEIMLINLETEGIIASSVQGYDDDEHTINTPGRSKRFWDND